jgi:hypothetical protein
MSKLPKSNLPVRSLGRSTLRRLRALRLLEGPTAGWPQNLTRLQVWQTWVAKGALLPGLSAAAALREYRFIKRVLACSNEPPPTPMVKLAAELNGDHELTLIGVQPHLGRVRHADLVTAALDLGLRVSGSRADKKQASMEDVYAVFPDATSALVSARVQEAVRDGAKLPSSNYLGRAMALPPALRLVAIGEMLRLSTSKRVTASIGSTLRALETMARLGLSAGGLDDLSLLNKFAEEETSISPNDARQRVIQRYGIALRGSRDWISNVSRGTAEAILSQMPDLELARTIFVKANQRVRERANESPGERHELVAETFLNSAMIKRAVENRMEQVRAIHSAYLKALKEGLPSLAAGVSVPFRVAGPAVFPDGQLGRGEQLLHFRLMRADVAVKEGVHEGGTVHEQQLTLNWLNEILDKTDEENLPILVVFDGVQPKGQGDAQEPFFIDFYRWSVFDPRCSLSTQAVSKRAELLKRNGLPFNATMNSGLLKPERFEKQFARNALTKNPFAGLIIIPLDALFHAMLYGELSFYFSRDTGGRALELQQIRLNDRAILVESRDGTDVTILRLRPKGVGPLRDFIVEEDTAKLIPECAAFTATRWFGHVEGQRLKLPERELLSATGSRPLPPAQYLFQSATRGLMTDEITMALHALLWDLSSVTLHDRRYVKATAEGDAKTPDRLAKRKLNHSPSSTEFSKYNRSPHIRAAEVARGFAEKEARRRSYHLPGSQKDASL